MHMLTLITENYIKPTSLLFIAVIILLSFCCLRLNSFAQDAKSNQLTKIIYATMCEGVISLKPINPTIIFPVEQKNVFCFSEFKSINSAMVIYHHWYRNDELITSIKLHLNPPRWSTYSNIRIRSLDIGPWRVEITDKNRNQLQVLRFSITE